MGEVCNAARAPAGKPASYLENEPKADDEPSRKSRRNEVEDEDSDPISREEHKVGPEDSGNGSRCANHGLKEYSSIAAEGGYPGGGGLGKGADGASDKVENKVAQVTEPAFHVVPKDRQEEHVARDMPKAPMHKHGREDCEVDGQDGSAEAWNDLNRTR